MCLKQIAQPDHPMGHARIEMCDIRGDEVREVDAIDQNGSWLGAKRLGRTYILAKAERALFAGVPVDDERDAGHIKEIRQELLRGSTRPPDHNLLVAGQRGVIGDLGARPCWQAERAREHLKRVAVPGVGANARGRRGSLQTFLRQQSRKGAMEKKWR